MPEQHQEADPRMPGRFGAQVVPPLGGGAVEKVVCALVEGRPVALALGGDRSVRMWDMRDHRQTGRPLTPATTEPARHRRGDALDGEVAGTGGLHAYPDPELLPCPDR